ncbi:hypothetical protein [Acetobacter oryzifermentans]|uniref:Uncharacterized protein n=1 Tax=Acetobacter oryzifermentans TaxID=1633874 RepID=A0ABM6AK91_9PROT|nr:hypothetical protein [Acetobacter oryzifermentans]ANA14151.1 hypothetical protein WG31_09160 [Acetobacter oryzifermentans]
MVNHPNRRRIALHNYDVSLGDIVFLVEHIDLNTNKTWLSVQNSAPIDNARVQKEFGPLGTFNNKTRYARGRVELTKWGAKEETVMFKRVK